MKNYRLLVFHFGETPPAVHPLSCANDAEATLRAMNLGPARIEVWDRARLVTTIPAMLQKGPAESEVCLSVRQPRAAVGGKGTAITE